MKFEEFKRNTHKRTTFDKYWYYGLCVVIILLSCTAFYFALTRPEKFKGLLYVAYGCFSLLLLLGLSGLYLLPNRYKIVEIPSELTFKAKKDITERLLNEISVFTFSPVSQYIVFKSKAKWWQSSFTVHFFYDESRFAFSVQGYDFDGGFIDFGGTERKRKMIAWIIMDLSMEMS